MAYGIIAAKQLLYLRIRPILRHRRIGCASGRSHTMAASGHGIILETKYGEEFYVYEKSDQEPDHYFDLRFGGILFCTACINLKSKEFYLYVISVIIVYMVVSYLFGMRQSHSYEHLKNVRFGSVRWGGMKRSTKILGGIIIVAVVVLLGGSLISSEFFHAKRYQQLMPVESREFSQDISQISLRDVPVVDRDSAVRLGDRKLGELVDLVSQFASG